MKHRLQQEDEALKKLGWEYLPISDTEWSYLKFRDDRCIAKQGDSTWNRDYRRVQK